MNKLVLSILLLLLAFTSPAIAQIEDIDKEVIKTANRLFKQKNYSASLKIYLQLDSIVDGDVEEFQYYIALCYLEQREDRTKAIPYLENNRSYFYELGLEEDYFFYLGLAYHLDYRFDEAILAYDKFLLLSGKRDKRNREVERWIDMCMDAKTLVANPVQVDIQNLGSKINTNYAEHTPVISADESVIIFNSNREGSLGGLMNEFGQKDTVFGKYFDDIYVSISINSNWLNPVKIGAGLNTLLHDDVVSISPDGQRLFIYRSDSMIYGNLFYCDLMGYSWGPLHKLPAPINTKYWENSGSISADGDVMYFSSNRPGGTGEGDFDIYMVRRLPDGSWAQAQNLGNMINTKYDEYAPFIHPDGKSLYFSSKGHNSMGGYDIFKSTLVNGKWSVPVNLGHPINTPDDDVDFVLSGDGKRGYYSSARPGGTGEKDIYVINFNSEYKDVSPGPVTLLKGTISACDQKVAPDSKLEVYDNLSGELMGVYRPNSATGKYMVIIPKGVDYKVEVSADNHLGYTMNIVTPENEPFIEEETNFILCPINVNEDCSKICEDGTFIQKPIANPVVNISSVTANDDRVVTIKNRELSINVWKNDLSSKGQIKKEGIKVVLNPVHGTLDFDDAFGEFDYQPNLSYTGLDSFIYKICSTNGDCDEAKVYIKINDPSIKNQLPEVNNDEVTVFVDSMMVINLLENDKDADGTIEFKSFKVLTSPLHGTLMMDYDLEKIMYTSNKSFEGEDKLTYQVCDNSNYCNSATAVIHVVKATIEPELEEEMSPQMVEALKAAGVDSQYLPEVIESNESQKYQEQEKDAIVQEVAKDSAIKEEVSAIITWEDQVLGEEITVYNIYFNYDKADLREESKESLEGLILLLKKYPKLKIEIGAHTDSRGASAYNDKLSRLRAESVKKYLVSKGVNSNSIFSKGFGEKDPVHECIPDDQCTELQHQLNRRITFTLTGSKLKLTSIKPDVVEIDPRPASAFIKQIDEGDISQEELEAYKILLEKNDSTTLSGLEFLVQIAAFNANIDPKKWLNGIEIGSMKKVKANHYRYYSRSYPTLAQAQAYANKLKNEKYVHAFVLAQLNGRVQKWKALKDILVK